MKRKIVAVVLMLAMLLGMTALTGCGNAAKKAEPNFTVPEGGYDGSEVTITFLKYYCNINKKNYKHNC